MKTPNELAALILERRLRPNPTVMQGDMRNILGDDGLGEAINRRWLVPNEDTGYLQVTPNMGTISEMEALAKDFKIKPPEPQQQPDTRYVLDHAFRRQMEPSFLSEIAAPGTGKPAPMFRPQTPTSASPTSSAPPTGAPVGSGIGDDVAVVENGETYQGKIASVNPNGRYKISFGGPKKPGAGDRDYETKDFTRLAA